MASNQAMIGHHKTAVETTRGTTAVAVATNAAVARPVATVARDQTRGHARGKVVAN